MKSYKEYGKASIGASDIASLTLRSPDGVGVINFGEDGEYMAYLVDGNAEIGEHYKKVYETHGWLKIYDDNSLAIEITGENIIVYTAGSFGCIIQVIEDLEDEN